MTSDTGSLGHELARLFVAEQVSCRGLVLQALGDGAQGFQRGLQLDKRGTDLSQSLVAEACDRYAILLEDRVDRVGRMLCRRNPRLHRDDQLPRLLVDQNVSRPGEM